MPDNAFYYRAAYSLVAVLYAGYALTLWLRGRRALERWRAGSDAP